MRRLTVPHTMPFTRAWCVWTWRPCTKEHRVLWGPIQRNNTSGLENVALVRGSTCSWEQTCRESWWKKFDIHKIPDLQDDITWIMYLYRLPEVNSLFVLSLLRTPSSLSQCPVTFRQTHRLLGSFPSFVLQEGMAALGLYCFANRFRLGEGPVQAGTQLCCISLFLGLGWRKGRTLFCW